MRYLVLSDIHGNLPALRAVLATGEAATCQGILSLGDQVNFGPFPREVLGELKALGALMLRGNHEDRIAHVSDPSFAGYNWRLLRWTARQVADVLPELPVDRILHGALLTHAAPGNPYRLLTPGELPALLEELPCGIRLMMSGHNHIPWQIVHRGRRAVNPGSLGMNEDGRGGVAPFALWDTQEGVTLCHTPYDTGAVARGFLLSGAAQAAPEMCRVVMQTIRTGSGKSVSHLIRHVSCTGDPALEETWRQADRTYPWDDPLSTPAFWLRQGKEPL